MKITPRALVMGSALVLAGGWFVFDYFGDQLGFGSPVKPGIGPAKSAAAEPIKTSGGTSETQLAMINSLSGISLASLAQTVERPLFNRARAPKPKPEPQVAVESDEPESGPQDFTLLGIVVANDDKTALLRFNKTNEIFHLKSGQSFSDWQLSEIGPKSVVVKKAELSFSLQLFEQPADAAEPQQQVEEPQQLRRLQQIRQRRQLQQPPQSKSRRQPPAINNDDSDSDGGDDQPQAVSRLEQN